MKKEILSILMIIKTTIEVCSDGCLKCSASGKCIICDPINMYNLVGNDCVKGNLTNCEVSSQTKGCMSCKVNYYLDSSTFICLPVSVAKITTNCNSYSTQQNCVSCDNNFYLSNGKCLPVVNSITNCVWYNSNKLCQQCSNGFIPSNDLTQCIQITLNSNCLSYTFITCRKCSTGHFFDQNNYFYDYANPSGLSMIVSLQGMSLKLPLAQLNVCRKTIIDNCIQFSSFRNCTKCQNGYYLKSNMCTLFPLPVINGCQIYNSAKTCSQCQSGMFLSNSTNCIQNVPIKNCAVYSGSSSTTTCIECSNDFYLQNNLCTLRLVSVNITNCDKRDKTSDICLNCTSGFNVTSDYRLCLSSISNCMTYTSSTYQSTSLSCSVCQNGYYLSAEGNSAVCIQGSISNCMVYESGSKACLTCVNKYYLSNGICVEHSLINNCLVYNPFMANKCSVCANGQFVFSFSKVCVEVTAKSNCMTYSLNGETCLGCNSGYYLVNNGCLPISNLIPNCLTYESQTCVECMTGFMLNSITETLTPTCDPPFDYISANCKTFNPFSLSKFTWKTSNANVLNCVACKTNSMTYTPLNSEAICIASNRGGMFASVSPFTAISNCFRYGLNYAGSPSLVCMQCNSGYFISGYFPTARHKSATITCILGCVTDEKPTQNSIFLDDLMGFVNICACTSSPQAAPCIIRQNCQVYAKNTHLTSKTDGETGLADWSCIKSANGTILQYPNLNNFVSLDMSPVTQTSLVATNYTSNGFLINESVVRPSVFNIRTPIVESAEIPVAGGTNNVLTNCEVGYYPISSKGTSSYSSTAVQCLRCTFGRYVLTAATSRSSTVYTTCTSSTSCQDVRVGGLSSFLSLAFGCHVCSWSGNTPLFPTLYVEYGESNIAKDNFNVFYQYDIRTTGSKNGFECAAAINVITSSSDTVLTGASMTNCGAYSISLPVTGTTVPNPLTYFNFCIACQTGYYPVYNIPLAQGGNKLPNWAVSSCQPVQFCDTTVVIGSFNGCNKCLDQTTSSSVVTYYAFTDYLLWKCSTSSTANCFILNWTINVSQGSTMRCLVCKNGFVLNLDNECETYTFPNQSTGALFSISIFNKYYTDNSNPTIDSHYVRMYYLLTFTSSVYGLSNGSNSPCGAGYILSSPSVLSPTLCISSSYLQKQIFPTTGSMFVKNCVAYASPSTLMVSFSLLPCIMCSNNFIPTADQSSCVSSINNCTIAQNNPSTVLCSVCNPNYLNANGVCYVKSIPNCVEYVNKENSISLPSVLCYECSSEYSLSITNTTCVFGEVKNCKTYSQGSTKNCLLCMNGYTLLSLSSGDYYCYPFLNSLNATSLVSGTGNSDGLNNATILPVSCVQSGSVVYGLKDFSTVVTDSTPQSICMPFTSVANCVEYDQYSTNIILNTFRCTVCKSGFYLNVSKICLPRSNTPLGCSDYSMTTDTCIQCSPGLYLNTNGTSCIPFPSGISGCLIYDGPSKCLVCEAPKYLQNGTCATSTTIPNCLVYSGNYTCQTCNPKYFLASEVLCSPLIAENCLTASSAATCETCADGFGLQTVGPNVNCVVNTLPNCLKATVVFPFQCLVCTGDFYSDSSGLCVAITLKIPNCVIYSSASTCAVCSKNSVLTGDGTVCNSTFYASAVDPNCEDNALNASPLCATCSFGYYFSSGVCIPCTANGFNTGCYSCDPHNNTICLLCSPGYFQNETMVCLKNKNKVSGNDSFPKSNSTNTTTSSCYFRFQILISLIFGGLLLK